MTDYPFVIQTAAGPAMAPRPPLHLLRRLLNPAYPDKPMLQAMLLQQGLTLDYSIDLAGWPAVETMAQRRMYGYTWVPPAAQENVQVAPGVALPGHPGYDRLRPPMGAILVPLDDAIPPRFITGPAPAAWRKPEAAPAAAAALVFGQKLDDGSWTIGPGDMTPMGATVEGPDYGLYIKETREFLTRYWPAGRA